MLPTIYDGRHMQHPQASRRAVRHVEFNMPQPVDVMVDGEVHALAVPRARYRSRRRGRLYMNRAWLAVRAAILWVASLVHFFISAPVLVFLGIFLDPRKTDWLQRSFCRRIVFLSGIRVEVQRCAGFRSRPHLFFHGESRQPV